MLSLCVLLTACNNDRGNYNMSDIANDNSTLEVDHFVAKFIKYLNEGIGNFGWTIIVFTIILKLVLSPLDIWQKMVARKNAKAMERMKPQLEALQEKYGDDKQRYQQEQMALYKKEHYSMMGSCLPTIVTLVVFFVIFAGFREMVGWKFATDYKNCYDVYDTAMTREIGEDWETYSGDAEKYAAAKDMAQTEVYDFYYSDEQVKSRGFLWIKNIFVPDSWKQAVPNYLTVTGQEGFATTRMTGLVQSTNGDGAGYDDVMGKVLGTGGWGKNGKWNGWLLLPVLSLVVSLLSQKLLTKAQGTPPPAANGKTGDSMQASAKMMQYMMPVMIGVFGLLYSSSFALYMLTSSVCSILFQLLFNVIASLVDKSKAKKNA